MIPLALVTVVVYHDDGSRVCHLAEKLVNRLVVGLRYLPTWVVGCCELPKGVCILLLCCFACVVLVRIGYCTVNFCVCWF